MKEESLLKRSAILTAKLVGVFTLWTLLLSLVVVGSLDAQSPPCPEETPEKVRPPWKSTGAQKTRPRARAVQPRTRTLLDRTDSFETLDPYLALRDHRLGDGAFSRRDRASSPGPGSPGRASARRCSASAGAPQEPRAGAAGKPPGTMSLPRCSSTRR